jgi:hypothetical protein
LQAATGGSGILILAVSYWHHLAKTGARPCAQEWMRRNSPFAQVRSQ